MTQKHEYLGNVSPIDPKQSPKKVWKHFYDTREAWAVFGPYDVEAMREPVEMLIRTRRIDTAELPSLQTVSKGAAKKISALLHEHDESGYRAAYWKELFLPETEFSPTMSDRHRVNALTPGGLILVIELHRAARQIVTAFRPHPEIPRVLETEAERKAHARMYFWRTSTMLSIALKDELLRALVAAAKPATTRGELWVLVSAMGRARSLAASEEFDQALERCERALASTSTALRDELRADLDWESLRSCLLTALRALDAEDFESALFRSEELLEVGPLLGADHEVDAFLDFAEQLFPWVPGEWGHLAELAMKRLVESDTSKPAAAFFTALESAAFAALAQSVELEAEATDHLFNETAEERASEESAPWMNALFSSIPQIVRDGSDTLRQLLAGLDWVQPEFAPVLGSDADSTANDYLLTTLWTEPNAHCRYFIVSHDYPDGYDVSEHVREGEAIWKFEAGEGDLLFVGVESPNPLQGETLAELVLHLESGDDIALGWKRIVQPKR